MSRKTRLWAFALGIATIALTGVMVTRGENPAPLSFLSNLQPVRSSTRYTAFADSLTQTRTYQLVGNYDQFVRRSLSELSGRIVFEQFDENTATFGTSHNPRSIKADGSVRIERKGVEITVTTTDETHLNLIEQWLHKVRGDLNG